MTSKTLNLIGNDAVSLMSHRGSLTRRPAEPPVHRLNVGVAQTARGDIDGDLSAAGESMSISTISNQPGRSLSTAARIDALRNHSGCDSDAVRDVTLSVTTRDVTATPSESG